MDNKLFARKGIFFPFPNLPITTPPIIPPSPGYDAISIQDVIAMLFNEEIIFSDCNRLREEIQQISFQIGTYLTENEQFAIGIVQKMHIINENLGTLLVLNPEQITSNLRAYDDPDIRLPFNRYPNIFRKVFVKQIARDALYTSNALLLNHDPEELARKLVSILGLEAVAYIGRVFVGPWSLFTKRIDKEKLERAKPDFVSYRRKVYIVRLANEKIYEFLSATNEAISAILSENIMDAPILAQIIEKKIKKLIESLDNIGNEADEFLSGLVG